MLNSPANIAPGPADVEHNSTDTPADARTNSLALPGWLILLAANWKILLAGTIVVGLIALVPQLLAPRQYVAESLIAPTVSWTQVQFEPKIKTVDSNSAQSANNGGAAITPERRQALVDLIRSSTIEQQVVQQLNGKLPESSLQPGEVVQRISGGLKPRSEILGVQAVADSPQAAIALADAWARAYVDHVNQVYTPPDADSSIVQLRDQAQADLQKAQDALTASLRDSRLEALDRQITADEQLLKLLQMPYAVPNSSPSSSSNNNSNQSGPNVNVNNAAGVDAASGQLNDYRLAERRTLDDIAQTLRRLDATRESVRALTSQAATDSSGTATAAAISLVKAQLVSISGGLPTQLQFQLPVTDTGTGPAQLQALVDSIEQARTEVAAEFELRRHTYEAHRDQQVAALEDELQSIRAQREAADAERKHLTAQRDLAADTYNALARKAEETKVAQGTQGHEVELASEATFATALPRFAPATVVAAALIGLLAAAALVLGASLVSVASTHPRAVRPKRSPASDRAPVNA